MMIAVNKLINRSLHAIVNCRSRLEFEEQSRLVARMQGEIAGYKALLQLIGTVFSLVINYDDPTIEIDELSKMDEESLLDLYNSTLSLQETESWAEILGDVAVEIEGMKRFLLIEAEKTRDLDIQQGKHQAITSYAVFFRDIEREVEDRREKAEQEKKQPTLFCL